VAEGKMPLRVQKAEIPSPPVEKMEQAAKVISAAKNPILMAGNGVVRGGACDELIKFAEKLNIPVATTFMAKGAMPFSHALSLGTVGLQAHDYVACGFDRADVIICVGFDMVEYHPHLWHESKDKKIIHINPIYAEVDEHYILEVGVVGDIAEALDGISEIAERGENNNSGELRKLIVDELKEMASDTSFPMKPQRILCDVRKALGNEDILISDVGAHKMWIARMYQAEAPNTCIISNGFASMGIALPGAISAKMTFPEKTIMAISGDAGFMMNSQEIETALRCNIAMVIMIWNDSKYGLIKWHQDRKFGRDSHIDFKNPDFVKYAESFGAKGYRVESADDLLPTIYKAVADDTVVIIDVPVDYSENMKLTEKLGNLVCPI
jgi:acetolactate synthase-1/2/3 large subunit